MDTGSNYWFLWAIYLTASAVFFVVLWRLTRFQKRVWLSYTIRAVVIALALTPWYASQDGSVFAPALMVVLLDAITIGGSAAARSMVPLFLALVLAIISASVWYVIREKLFKKSNKKQHIA